MIEAMLANRQRPDLPPVPVCFPIADYFGIYKNLQAIRIGSVKERDCLVTSIEGSYPILKRLENVAINVDELDYLAKRLESFDKDELAQFQGAIASRDYFDMTDLINLTFCCQSVTVVEDFTDLTAVGRKHYMNLHGGLTEDDLKTVDFHKTGLSLLLNEEGTITPYGVVYENGMDLEQYYDGLYFPDYRYSSDTLLTVAITDPSLPEDTKNIAWLYLPAEDCQIERALLRAGIFIEHMRLQYIDSELPAELVELECIDSIFELNGLCTSIKEMNDGRCQKAAAALQMSCPANLPQAWTILKQIDLFDFVPDVSSPEEYGRYMIRESGYFEYDDELEEFYDFKKYGEQRIAREYGLFTEGGYISYHGFISIDEVMAGIETERIDMKMIGM